MPLRSQAFRPQHVHTPIPMPKPGHARFVLKLVLLAVTAAVALIGAALIAVPSAEGVRLCLDFALCRPF